jgi:hypothetical protein
MKLELKPNEVEQIKEALSCLDHTKELYDKIVVQQLKNKISDIIEELQRSVADREKKLKTLRAQDNDSSASHWMAGQLAAFEDMLRMIKEDKCIPF